MENIVMDRKTLRALASDKKREIMKLLAKSQLTLSDISQKMGMSPSSVKEHLDGLRTAGLIEQKDEGRKWKYYVLTNSGKQLMSPVEKRIMFMIALSALAMAGSFWSMLGKFSGFESPMLMKVAYDTASTGANEALEIAAGSGNNMASEMAPRAMDFSQTVNIAAQFPHIEIAILVFSSIVFGICIGYALKRNEK